MNILTIIKKILFTAFSVIVLMNGGGYFFGEHTKYCPLSHILVTTENCIILDESEEIIRIAHRDRDSLGDEFKNYLEIRDKAQSLRFKMPDNLSRENPTAKLIPNENAISVNGERLELSSVKF